MVVVYTRVLKKLTPIEHSVIRGCEAEPKRIEFQKKRINKRKNSKNRRYFDKITYYYLFSNFYNAIVDSRLALGATF